MKTTMRVRKILAGTRIIRMGPMREMPTGWLMTLTATTVTRGVRTLRGTMTMLTRRRTRR